MLAPSSLAAAHSMDTTWFAVDEDGHVAIMHSGEPGCGPLDPTLRIEPEELYPLREWPDGIPDATAFETTTELDLRDWLEWDQLPPFELGGRGLFLFDADRSYGVLPVYKCARRPLRPANERALPESLARGAVRLRGARFAESPMIEPSDYTPMRHWVPWVHSVRRWSVSPSLVIRSYRAWLEEIDSVFSLSTVPGRDLRVDGSRLLAEALRQCAESQTIEPFSMLVREAPSIVASVLREDERAALEGDDVRWSDAAQLAQRVLDRAPVFVERSTRGEPTSAVARLHEYQLAFESLVARGEVSHEWLRDDARRFIVEPDDWLALATREDAAHEGPMSTVLPTPDVLRTLASRAADTLAAESIAREITAQTGGDPRVVYWREAGPIEIAQSRALRDEGAASAAIDGLGFALDPVVKRVPVLLVEGREAPATPRETPENSDP